MRSARLLVASGVLVGLTAGCDSRFTPPSTALQLRGMVSYDPPGLFPLPHDELAGGDIRFDSEAHFELRLFTDLELVPSLPDTISVEGTYARFGQLFLFTTGQSDTEEHFAGAANSAGAFDALSVGALPTALRIAGPTPFELRFAGDSELGSVEVTSGEAIQAIGQLVRIGETDFGGPRTLFEVPTMVGGTSQGLVFLQGATLELEGTAFDLHLRILVRPVTGEPYTSDQSYHGRIVRHGPVLIFDSGAAFDAFGILDEGVLTLYDVKLASNSFPWNRASFTWEFAVDNP